MSEILLTSGMGGTAEVGDEPCDEGNKGDVSEVQPIQLGTSSGAPLRAEKGRKTPSSLVWKLKRVPRWRLHLSWWLGKDISPYPHKECMTPHSFIRRKYS